MKSMNDPGPEFFFQSSPGEKTHQDVLFRVERFSLVHSPLKEPFYFLKIISSSFFTV